MSQTNTWESSTHASIYAPDLTPDDVQQIYNNWDDYEEISHLGTCHLTCLFHYVLDWQYAIPEEYHGPRYAATTVQKYHPSDHDMSIADVGAGCGFVGKELRQLGFTNLTAIEGATKFLQRAGDIYTVRYPIYIGPQSRQRLKDDEFDCLVTCGVFIPNHLAPLDINELIRITKPGKIIITVMREEYLSQDAYRDKLEPYMEELESHGCWTKLERTHIPDYHCDSGGYIFVHKVLIHGEPQFKSSIL